jgi:MFS family permease
LNVPLGLVAFLLTLRLVHGEAVARRPFDTKGFVLSGIGCSALMFACDLASHTPFNLPQVLLFGLTGAAAMTLAVRHLRRTPHPLVDLAALKIPTFAVAMWGGSLFRIAINSAPFLLPLMFQLVFGFDATTSGMLLLALFAGNFCMKPGTTWVMRRWGFRRVLLVNGLLVALGFVACAFLSPAVSKPAIMAVLFFSGMCRSMQFTCLNTISFGDIPSDRMNGASTLSSIFFQMSTGLGVAFGAIVLQAANVLYSSGANAQIHECSPTLADFRIAFIVMALISALALIDVVPLPAEAGAQVSGHRSPAIGDSAGMSR